jgi:hypothetical protein
MCECDYFGGHCPSCGTAAQFVKVENWGFAYCETCGLCAHMETNVLSPAGDLESTRGLEVLEPLRLTDGWGLCPEDPFPSAWVH